MSSDGSTTPASSGFLGTLRRAGQRAWSFCRDHDLVPRGSRNVGLKASLPKSWFHWLTTLLVVTIFAVYVVQWIKANSGMLFDPLLQNDDARTGVFMFHRYGPEHALKDDPIANEMLSLVTPFLRLLYVLLV